MKKTMSWDKAKAAAGKKWKEAIKEVSREGNPYYQKQLRVINAYIKILEALGELMKEV